MGASLAELVGEPDIEDALDSSMTHCDEPLFVLHSNFRTFLLQ
jgi:hypothetical protein